MAEDEVDFHYVCFVKSSKTGHLYELGGDRKGPVDHGILQGRGCSKWRDIEHHSEVYQPREWAECQFSL